mmetsp:Transcript_27078/g.45018  ORF Transcript_27078/g.45018 Transcript_27078/m.45018 type:complete len:261 (-) Transcript_27078:97-879(-)
MHGRVSLSSCVCLNTCSCVCVVLRACSACERASERACVRACVCERSQLDVSSDPSTGVPVGVSSVAAFASTWISSVTKFLLVYTHRSAAMFIALWPTATASRPSTSMRARAAAVANIPPEPIPITPSMGSSTSPFPVSVRDTFASATIITASSRRKYLSIRHAFAISTQARIVSGCSCSLFSSRSKSVIASAVAPAKPAITPSFRIRTLRAFGLMICEPSETCPSPITNTLSSLRTERMVVARSCCPYQPMLWSHERLLY